MAAKAKKTKQKSRAGDDEIIDGTFTEADDGMDTPQINKTKGRPFVAIAALSCAVVALGIAGASLYEQQRAATAQMAQINILQDAQQDKQQAAITAQIAPLQAEIAAANATIDQQAQQIDKLEQMLERIANTPQLDAKNGTGPSADVMVALMMWQAVTAAEELIGFAPVIAALPNGQSRLMFEEISQAYQAIAANTLAADGQRLLAVLETPFATIVPAPDETGFLADVAGWLSRAVKLETVSSQEAGGGAAKKTLANDDKAGGWPALHAMTPSQIYDATQVLLDDELSDDELSDDDGISQWRARYEAQQALAARLLAFVTTKLTEQKE